MIATKFKNTGFIAFLLALLITTGVLSYKNASEYSELKIAFDSEKKDLEFELNTVLKKYEKALNKKDDVSLNLRNKLHEIIKLKDTIHNLKAENYRLLRFYRKRILILNKQNELLFSYIDSLSSKNNQLTTKNDSVTEVLIQKRHQNNRLKHKNNSLDQEKKLLKEKIAIAQVLKIATIKVVTMKKRRSGKYTHTNRASKTTAFKITFNLLENKIIKPGLKPIYIQIVYNNQVISPVKEVLLTNKQKIFCNDILTVQYNKKILPVISFINVDKNSLTKGFYHVNVFIDGIFIKKTTLKLK
ncbi:hypothetical protein G1K46_01895 [Tenacibaculum finnmarkense]|uniref:hypothetical protein n=1 Tax=Tenacibaculum finnmarkense TaxID=2781243 RepID=UPI001EFB3A81|nr:hypothetical protein [Tenacibaculum finnmarkense]MCG8761488.1 hypothetical protein [Tenacibaculum finnmarkense]MCG8786862.1 hypothetical protein [Tenacibaculum finnmarkense]